MAQWTKRAKRKASGGRYQMSHKKKAKDTGRDPVYTKIAAAVKSRVNRLTGGSKSTGLLTASHANVASKGKTEKLKIISVAENTAGRTFVRQGIVTKGAIIKLDKGLARVTSRPTRDGVVNAVLLK